jgi:hypothetical protein
VGQDLLARVCAEIATRREELRAAVDEYEELQTIAAALERDASRAKDTPRARATPRPKVTASEEAAPRARARPVAGSTSSAAGAKAPARSSREADQQAIVAALEHGSHTVSELVVVTALSGPSIRASVRALIKAGIVARAKREGDGKAAYALAS